MSTNIQRGLKEKKREEILPFLLLNIAFATHQRQKLLQILFNLVVEPNEAQRHLLVSSCRWLATVFSPQGPLTIDIFLIILDISQDLLPQCWEQVNSNHPERRIFVSDCTGALSPFVDPDLRMSLLLSILSQLSTDSDIHVRISVTNSLARLLAAYPNCDSIQVFPHHISH